MKEKIITESYIEGDLKFDGEIIFENDVEITGSLIAEKITGKKSITIHYSIEAGGSIKAGGYIKAGYYHNYSFSVLDLEKIKTKRILFTPSFFHERKFWIEQLNPIEGIDNLISVIETGCWSEIIAEGKKHSEKLLSYKHYLPAVRQALELLGKNGDSQ